MLQRMTDRLRASVADALASTRADHYRPVKLLREVLGTANDLAGRPFCSERELAERRAALAAGSATTARREVAPVMVYFDGKDHRTKKKIEELLRSKEIAFQVLDVTDDEATRSWATTQAKQLEFPLVFIAGEPVGGLHELTQLDVNGQLARRVFGVDG
jgi:glutaredoxin